MRVGQQQVLQHTTNQNSKAPKRRVEEQQIDCSDGRRWRMPVHVFSLMIMTELWRYFVADVSSDNWHFRWNYGLALARWVTNIFFLLTIRWTICWGVLILGCFSSSSLSNMAKLMFVFIIYLYAHQFTLSLLKVLNCCCIFFGLFDWQSLIANTLGVGFSFLRTQFSSQILHKFFTEHNFGLDFVFPVFYDTLSLVCKHTVTYLETVRSCLTSRGYERFLRYDLRKCQ